MCIGKRVVMVSGMLLVALLMGVGGLRDTARPAAARTDPAALFRQYAAALNAGDIDGVLETFADNAAVGGVPGCLPVDCIGKDAIRNVMEFYVAENLAVTITSLKASGNTATGSIEPASDFIRATGSQRIVGSISVEVTDEKISGYHFAADFSDPQTANFVAYSGANSVTVELGPGRDADQSPGTAVLTRFGDRTTVLITTTPGPVGVPQPVHIHQGSCADLGAVAFSLQDIGGGKSAMGLDVLLGDLRTGNYAIAVQKSKDEPDVYVACGDIPAAAPKAPIVEPAPAVAEVPAVVPAPPTGSGGLLAEGASSVAAWWYALVAGDGLLVMVGLAGLGKARRRT